MTEASPEIYRSKSKFPLWAKILMVLTIVIGPVLWMTYDILQGQIISCEVCMTFQGRQNCRVAQGADQQQCQQTATDNACATISSGMTESIQCSQSQPTSATFFESTN